MLPAAFFALTLLLLSVTALLQCSNKPANGKGKKGGKKAGGTKNKKKAADVDLVVPSKGDGENEDETELSEKIRLHNHQIASGKLKRARADDDTVDDQKSDWGNVVKQ